MFVVKRRDGLHVYFLVDGEKSKRKLFAKMKAGEM